MAPNPATRPQRCLADRRLHPFGGPLGHEPGRSRPRSAAPASRSPSTAGRLIGSCTNLTDGPALYLLDPVTLDTLAFLQLPYVPPPAGTNPAPNTTGGAYFYLDNQDRVVLAASNRQILVFGVDDSGGEPRSSRSPPTTRRPASRPTSGCRRRCPTRGPDLVRGPQERDRRRARPEDREVRLDVLNEEIENSFAIASDGIYIVSDKSMYKFRAGGDLKPRVDLELKLPQQRRRRSPGQFNAGLRHHPHAPRGLRKSARAPRPATSRSPTTPTRWTWSSTARATTGRAQRVVCEVPVFRKGASATENSLIGMGHSLVVENNYGYDLQKFNDVIAGGVPSAATARWSASRA